MPMQSVPQIRIFLASPGDVNEERAAITGRFTIPRPAGIYRKRRTDLLRAWAGDRRTRQARRCWRAAGDRGGDAATCFNIGLIYHELGDLDKAIEYVERCVELDEQIEHPDLESDRRTLNQLKAMRGGGGQSPEDQAAEAMRQLTALYQQGGADAVRDVLNGQAPDEVIEQVISIIKQNLGE